MKVAGLICSLLAGALLAVVPGCGPRGPVGPRYVVGAPYQIGGLWRYPAEEFSRDETGIATMVSSGGVTANGERFDAGALAAGHRTLQLPAIARITNLENGRQVVVRINDRGPADPARTVAVTRRTAELLGSANPQAFRVRLQVLEQESRQVAAALQAGGGAGGEPRTEPAIAVAAAPRGGVQSEALAPPSGVVGAGQVRSAASLGVVTQPAPPPPAAIPLRLPEQVGQVPARPGRLAIDCGAFASAGAAELMRARLAGFGAATTTDYNAPRERAYIVRIGRLDSLSQAEGTLRRVLPAGCLDGRIVVE